jgi:squalene-associated FAD-dependent desaturase
LLARLDVAVNPEVIVVGGGLAGIAAAYRLGAAGKRVLLIESRPRLGGRASSFHDLATDSEVDNCQHVAMGCCTAFLELCGEFGIAQEFVPAKELYFIGPDGRVNRFGASGLPAPLHLAWSFWRLSYFSMAEKLSLARGLAALAKLTPQAAARFAHFEAWLDGKKQSARLKQLFWHTVCVSALSETLDRIEVLAARKVFVDGFVAHRDAWRVLIPRVPFDVLYAGPVKATLSKVGVEVQTGVALEKLVTDGEKVMSLQLRGGGTIAAEQYVVAVPFYRLLSLLPDELARHPDVASIGQLEGAPISSIHLWVDRELTKLPHAVFVEGIVQWVFNRTVLDGQSDETLKGFYYQVVVSASRNLAGLSQGEIAARVLKELAIAFPAAKECQVLHSRQVTEHRAVFAPLAGHQGLRPAQQSPLENLQWAGDWTQTGWPATMEGAVRSGALAANNVLRRLGQEPWPIAPPLPVAWASRLLFGL